MSTHSDDTSTCLDSIPNHFTVSQTEKKRLLACTIANGCTLLVVIVLVLFFKKPENEYIRFGPDETLVVVGIHVNTVTRYVLVVIIICALRVVETVVHELGFPILNFAVYDPEKRIIHGISKNELQFFSNMMWLFSNLRQVMMIVIAVTQVDIAIISVLCSELTSIYTIRLLLNKKMYLHLDDNVTSGDLNIQSTQEQNPLLNPNSLQSTVVNRNRNRLSL